MLSLEQFSRITTLIFAASLDQRKWSGFLEYLADITGVRVHMFGHDFENNIGLDLLSTSYSPDYVDSYNKHYSELNSWAPGFSKFDVGVTISSEAMCSRENLEKSEFYNDWIRPQEDIVAGGGTILFKENSRMFVIGGNIRRKDEHFEKNWLDIVTLLTPHLQQALEINRVITNRNIDRIALGEGVNPVGAAIFIVNNNRQIVYSNINSYGLDPPSSDGSL